MSVGNHFRPPQGWLPPAVNCKPNLVTWCWNFFFFNNCDIWALWNVIVSKKDAKVCSSLK